MRPIIRFAGVLAWIAVGVPIFIASIIEPWRLAGWLPAYAVFGLAFVVSSRTSHPSGLLLAIQALAVAAMVFLLCNGFEGTLLVLIAMQLGGAVSRKEGLTWIAAQTFVAAAAMSVHWSPHAALLITPPYLGFQLLAFFVFESMARLAAAHAELRAVHEIISDSSRIAERLRIARELHDALGHHLTALSLNVEVALQKSDGAVREHLATAQSLARQLLGDVREIAASTPARGDVDVAQALTPLVSHVPRPRIHLEMEPGLRVDDPEQAHVIVRCTQEIVTNAARHSSAENLWIVIARDEERIRIHARDDGRGAERITAGFGLRSMRARVEETGGELRVAVHPGSGVEVIARI